MFGIKNKIAYSFIAKIGAFGVDVAVGFFEEVSFNITGAGEANAIMIPDNISTPTVDPSIIQVTSVAASSFITSPYVRKKAFKIIAGATFNVI